MVDLFARGTDGPPCFKCLENGDQCLRFPFSGENQVIQRLKCSDGQKDFLDLALANRHFANFFGLPYEATMYHGVPSMSAGANPTQSIAHYRVNPVVVSFSNSEAFTKRCPYQGILPVYPVDSGVEIPPQPMMNARCDAQQNIDHCLKIIPCEVAGAEES